MYEPIFKSTFASSTITGIKRSTRAKIKNLFLLSFLSHFTTYIIAKSNISQSPTTVASLSDVCSLKTGFVKSVSKNPPVLEEPRY